MKYFRIVLADGVFHYMSGDNARAVRKKFERDYPTLPKVSRVLFLRNT